MLGSGQLQKSSCGRMEERKGVFCELHLVGTWNFKYYRFWRGIKVAFSIAGSKEVWSEVDSRCLGWQTGVPTSIFHHISYTAQQFSLELVLHFPVCLLQPVSAPPKQCKAAKHVSKYYPTYPWNIPKEFLSFGGWGCLGYAPGVC